LNFRRLSVLVLAFAALFLVPQSASALLPHSTVKSLGNGAERITYRIGPLTVGPGQNNIDFRPITGVEKPAVDGWITRIKPDLVNVDGSIPLSSKVMFHHGVWLNSSRKDATAVGSGVNLERFYATGEEKTIASFPKGYGYQYKATDIWLLNHMIHNLTPQAMTLYATYTIDFIPADSPAAEGIKPVTPIWMDVQNGHSLYPVFDVHRGTGGKDGRFTYPDEAKNPYPDGNKQNEWTVDRDGVLLSTAGHVHAGGLWTDLFLKRHGAKYAGPKCKKPGVLARGKIGRSPRSGPLSAKERRHLRKANKRLAKRKKSARKKFKGCKNKQPSVSGDKVHLYRSRAKYFEPAGPVSWDMAMYGSPANWRVEVKKGDVLSTSATYETKIASWPESMGIMVVYMAEDEHGTNPYRKRVDYKGRVVHGHYKENSDHGGGLPLVGRNPAKLPDGVASDGNPFTISDFTYNGADFRLPGEAGRPPTVKKGQSLSFQLSDYDVGQKIWHSLTSCKTPCNRSTGIAYPIADGKFQFESGQMGVGGPPTVERTSWSTPSDLPRGTYTFFCRIHPLMRGAFRVK
jgi:hypothetical protein